jgi:hypothetical protein
VSPSIWLTVGIVIALIAFPLMSLLVVVGTRLTGGSKEERPRELDTSVPGRTIPGGDK